MRITEYTQMNSGMFCLLLMLGGIVPANDNRPLRPAGLFDLAVHLVRQEYREYTP